MKNNILFLLFYPTILYSQTETVILNKGILHTHTVDKKCDNTECIYSCKECNFKMKKIQITIIKKDSILEIYNNIPDNIAYCPLCKCPRCPNIILKFYKGISYQETLTNKYVVTKITKKSDYVMFVEITHFFSKYPEIYKIVNDCQVK